MSCSNCGAEVNAPGYQMAGREPLCGDCSRALGEAPATPARTMRIRMGLGGWERYNTFTDEWWPVPFRMHDATFRDLAHYYSGVRLEVER